VSVSQKEKESDYRKEYEEETAQQQTSKTSTPRKKIKGFLYSYFFLSLKPLVKLACFTLLLSCHPFEGVGS
jgi:hypothetical protein